jgi:chromosome segregation ATPase
LIASEKRISTLQGQIDLLSHDANKLKIDIGGYEKANSQLQNTVMSVERRAGQLEQDNQRLHREVMAVRELAHSADRDKDAIQGQYIQTSLENERLCKALDAADLQKEALEKEIRAERLRSERFETMLNTERARQMQNEKSKTVANY